MTNEVDNQSDRHQRLHTTREEPAGDGTTEKKGLLPPAAWVFLLFQVAFLGIAVAATARRAVQLRARLDLPKLRQEPLTVRPRYDDPRVVTDEQLLTVLTKLRPQLAGKRPSMNHVDHALRFWGVSAEFDDPKCLSGEQLRHLLVDHTTFSRAWGEKAKPFLIARKDGTVGVRLMEGLASQSHEDHTLACLAEVGTPLSFPVRTIQGQTTLYSLVERAMRSFSLNQAEYEWSGMLFALYVEDQGWVTKEGQHINFDLIAERMMRLKYHKGVCFGNHRLHTLTVFLRVDEQHKILSPEMRQQIVAHLLDATKKLVQHQDKSGCWDGNWPYGKPQDKLPSSSLDSSTRRILATGHALEWWAFAPPEVLPPREVIVRAGQWLTRTIGEMDDAQIKRRFTFLSHAGRALALWRGAFTADVWRRLKTKQNKTT